jgi:glutamine cyclotransferase
MKTDRFLFLLLLFTFSGCPIMHRWDGVVSLPCRVIQSYPHDSNAQTEGLVFRSGVLYEGTGPCKGTPSSLRKMDIESGNILRIHELPSPFFGEGITIHNNKIIQLTYTSHLGFVYSLDGFDLLGEFTYPTEGWGLTTDGEYLILSDGTSILYYIDPHTYKMVKRLEVRDQYGPVSNLNELEFFKGVICANVYLTSKIVCIRPETGRVVGLIDLAALLKDHFNDPEILDKANGIAHNPTNDHLYVTGKYWPRLFEIEIK